jgi:hypothetical protein
MDKSWVKAKQFSPPFVAGLEDFMATMKQRYPRQNIRFPCEQCVNLVDKSLDKVENDIFLHGMSPSYTTWIYHGEGGGGTDIIEPSDVHGSHHDDWIAEEE